MYDFVSKLMLVKQLKLEKGAISFFNDRYLMLPASTLSSLQKQTGANISINIYKAAKEVNRQVFNNTFKTKYSVNRAEYLDLLFNLLNSMGLGIFSLDQVDFNKKTAIVHCEQSTLATAYGKSDNAVDHLSRGSLGGAFSVLFDDPTIEVIENKCLSKNNGICEFILKPKDQIDLSNNIYKYQIG